MKRIMLIFICIFFTTQAYAEEWDKTDKFLMTSFDGLLIADFLQTVEISRNSDFQEDNNVIKWVDNKVGTFGIAAYFVSYYIGAKYIADKLPSTGRKIWLGLLNGIQIDTVHGNYKIGVKIPF